MIKTMKRLAICMVVFTLLLTTIPTALAASYTIEPIDDMQIFPADNIWNVPIDTMPVDSHSAAYISTMRGYSLDAYFAFPYNVVDNSVTPQYVPFENRAYSDNVPIPIPNNPLIEPPYDAHMLIINRDTNMLYELYHAVQSGYGSWSATAGAVYDLTSNALRGDPPYWSADAAGLPMLPGIMRYEEIEAGEITHALRFSTYPTQANTFIWPARAPSGSGGTSAPPAGQRFRLKASYDISGFSPQNQIILKALKKYGMIVADNNAASMVLYGTDDARWNTNDRLELRNIHGSDFEAVDVSSLMINEDSGQARVNPGVTPTPSPTRTPTPVPTPTPIPTQAFAGSENLGITNSNGIWALDYNGNGNWDGTWIDKSLRFGKSGDIPVVADWNGDGTSDIGVFRPSTGYWYLDYNKDGVTDKSIKFGKSGDIPVVADWNGDGNSDIAVFRPSNGYWYLDYNKNGIAELTFRFGKTGDCPVVGDWNGDGHSDIAVFRPSNGYWYLNYNAPGVTDKTFKFGKSGDIPVVGDWNGDGADDAGVFRPSAGQWGLDYNKDGITDKSVLFGKSGDIPVVGDWNGDGKSDIGVFRPSAGQWGLDYNKDGITDSVFSFGKTEDIPVVGDWL